MIYRFSGFFFDSARYELRKLGELVTAEPQVLELLAHLLEHRDRLVTKEELLESVWDGRHVADSAISRTIREVRRALGDSGAQSRFVKTIYGRGFRFVGEGVTEEPSGDTKETREPAAPAPLPVSITPLIGRRRELAEVEKLLGSSRLVTLTGPGGTGKTRLALAVAREVRDRFSDGAVFVPLINVRDGEGLGSAIARELGAGDVPGRSTWETLAERLRDRRLLLVLDNFEQLAGAAPELADLLRGCPGVVALVTSRFVLRIPGEQEYPVPPLALPERESSPSDLVEVPAVALFLSRARAALPSFRPDEEALAYVAEICRRLDGLPLAIELAAARIKILPPRVLWERLAERLDLLSRDRGSRGSRHPTLRDAHAWSHGLLDEEERILFRRLAVFSRGFPLEGVERICDLESGAAVEVLASLVDKSLVESLRAEHGEPRFRLLETTREFALEHLRDAGEERRFRNRHVAWCEELARRGEAALVGGDQEKWLTRLDADLGNLLAAIHWSREGGELVEGLRIAASLGRYWSARGTYREGRGELEALLGHPGISSVAPREQARGLVALGLLIHLLCEYRVAAERLEEARRIFEEIGDRDGLATVLNHRAWVALQIEPLREAEALALEALQVNEESGNPRGAAVALNNLGYLEFYRGRAKAAEERFQAALELRREAGDDRGAAFTLVNLAMVLVMLAGDLERADGWLDEAESLLTVLDDLPLLTWVDCMRAGVETRRGRPEAALERLERNAFDSGAIVHPDGSAWIHLLAGDALRALEELERATAELVVARETWRSLGVSWGEALTAVRLAELAEASGRVEETRALYEEAAELGSRFGLEGVVNEARAALEAINA